MNLAEYIEAAKKELDAFEKRYREESVGSPENFPLEMNAGEWFEQEIAARELDWSTE